MFRGLLAGDAVEITGVAPARPVPAALRSLRTMLARYYGDLPNVIVEPGVKTGVQLAIDNPKEVGADRRGQHPGRARPLRRTVDRGRLRHHHQLRRDQREGRVPRRGVRAGHRDLFDALAARAAQLRKVEPAQPRSVIGKNTVECLQSGMYYGFAGQVDRIVERMIEEIGPVKP
jgi:type III pantothenate kinase